MQQKQILKMQQVLIQQNLLNKVDLTSLKSEIAKSDIDKVETTPVHLSKLSDAAKMKLLQRLLILTMTQKFIKLKRKLLIMIIIISILLHKYLIRYL